MAAAAGTGNSSVTGSGSNDSITSPTTATATTKTATPTTATTDNKGFGLEAFRTISSSGFRGLVNQGATCYLNSLVQTLYMTPEIRDAVFQWRFDVNGPLGSRPHLSIAFQLQKLFAKLQTSAAAAVSTEGLTKSFGWDRAHVFTQHDVQEFIQKLYEMIEQTCKGTPLAKTWVELNHGTWRDYLECQKCKSTRGKDEQFLNLSLEVKGFKSIEESLADFVKPGVMDGNNSVMCGPCGSKQTSIKGYRFRSFPYLLALQLKRFDMNWNTMQRIKLENMITFPHRLDLSSYLAHEEGGGNPRDHVYECFSILMHTGTAVGGHYYSFTKDFVSGKWYEFNDATVKELTERDLETVFSDSVVSDDQKATEVVNGVAPPMSPTPNGDSAATATTAPPFDDAGAPPPPPPLDDTPSSLSTSSSSVPSAPGDVPVISTAAQYSGSAPPAPVVTVTPASTYSVAANAYMLMYRRIDNKCNMTSVPASRIPPEVKAEVDAENLVFEEAKAEFKRLAGLVNFTVHYGPVATAADVEVKVSVECDTTRLSDVIRLIADMIGISGRGVSMTNLRLRAWDSSRKKPTQPLVGNELLVDYKLPSYVEMYIEERETSAEFEEYNGEPLSLQLIEFDSKTTDFKAGRPLNMLETNTLHDLRVAAATMVGVSHERIRLVIKLDPARPETATDITAPSQRDNITLVGLQLKNGEMIYAESTVDDATDSLLMEKFKLLAFQIPIQYNILGARDATVSSMGPTATMNESEAKAAEASMNASMDIIAIDERSTLAQLKKELSARMNVPMNEFRIRKSCGGAEFKDLSKQLSMYHMRDVGEIWLEYGRPMLPGDFNTRINLQIPPVLQRRIHFSVTHTYQLVSGDDGSKRHEWHVSTRTRDAHIDGTLSSYIHRVDWEFPAPLAGPLLIQMDATNKDTTFDSSNSCQQKDCTSAGGIEITVTLYRHRLPPAPFCHELTINAPSVTKDYFFDMPLPSALPSSSTDAELKSTATAASSVTVTSAAAATAPVRFVLLAEQKDLFYELGDLIVNENFTFDDLTKAISTLPGAPPANLMRLRECLNDQLSRCWLPHLPMKKNCPGLTDGTAIYVQPLEAEEKLTADHLLVWIQQWCPPEMILTAPREVPLLKTMKICELKTFLATKLGPNSATDDVLVVAPRPDERAEVTNIPNLLWHNSRLRATDTIGGPPWRLRAGDFIFYMDKNSGRTASNLSGSDAASRIAMLNMTNPSPTGGASTSRGNVPRREAALTIFSPDEIDKRERDTKAMEDALRAELLAAGIDIGEAMAAARQQDIHSSSAR